MDAVQGLFLKRRIKKLDFNNNIRVKQAKLYTEMSSKSENLKNFEILHIPEEINSVYHHFVVLVDNRDDLRLRLWEEFKIETLVHYTFSIESSPFAKRIRFASDLVSSKRIRERAVSLPIGPHVSSKEIVRIAESIEKALKLND